MGDGRSDPMLPEEIDVLVIGAGAGGAAAAQRLASHGVSVVLIDAGPAFDASDYSVDVSDWENQGFPSKPSSQGSYEFGAGQAFDPKWDHLRKFSKARGWTSTRTHRVMGDYHHVRGIGGTTLKFTGWAHRFHTDSFRLRSNTGQGFDWPLGYDDLEPYYHDVEWMIGVAGPPGISGRPMSSSFPTPAHTPSRLSQVLARGAARRGLSWTENSVVAPSRAYRGRPACNYCGCCQWGCPRGDKGSADVTFVAAALETGRCKVYPLHSLVRLERGGDDMISKAVVASQDGQLQDIKPRHVVLAAGAIETPRLLLAMDGLANESGRVGHHLMETVWSYHTGLHPDPVGSHRGYPEDTICWDFDRPDAIHGAAGGGIILPLAATERFLGPASYARKLIKGFGSDHKKRLREMFGHAVGVQVICENLPSEGRYVALSDTLTDRFGMPIARIESVLPDADLRLLSGLAGMALEVMKASGVDEVLEQASSYEKFSSTHLAGTCMMGKDSETSVVNEFGRTHRWKNLWITDASVLPSMGNGVGLSVTIQALALRTADRLVAAMRGDD